MSQPTPKADGLRAFREARHKRNVTPGALRQVMADASERADESAAKAKAKRAARKAKP